MPLPKIERFKYNRATLVEVISQLRFPPILRIEAGEPVDFQDRVRRKYPIYEAFYPAMVPPEVPEEVRRALQQAGFHPGSPNFTFQTEDRDWKLSLTRDFISLSTSRYGVFEEFKQRLLVAVSEFQDIYQPAFYSRIGLRYRNFIDREKLNLEQSPWSDLLEKPVAGELSSAEFAEQIPEVRKTIQFKFENIMVTFRHGLGRLRGKEQTGYVLDFDAFCPEKTEVGYVGPRLDRLHYFARTLFRWSITDILHNSMEPSSMGPLDEH